MSVIPTWASLSMEINQQIDCWVERLQNDLIWCRVERTTLTQ